MLPDQQVTVSLTAVGFLDRSKGVIAVRRHGANLSPFISCGVRVAASTSLYRITGRFDESEHLDTFCSFPSYLVDSERHVVPPHSTASMRLRPPPSSNMTHRYCVRALTPALFRSSQLSGGTPCLNKICNAFMVTVCCIPVLL